MAENNADKEALKAQKEAEKAAKKAKEERIKQSKPKKEGTVFSRIGKSVSKFFKDFAGTCKKITWPTGKQVLKNSGVVLSTIIVIGLVVFGIDWVLTEVFDLGKQAVVSLAEQVGEEDTTVIEGTTAAGTAETTVGSEETTKAESEEKTTAENGSEEETTLAEEETTQAAE